MHRDRMLIVLGLLIGFALPAPLADAKDKQEWAEGIPYVTDYDEALAMAKESGRMLLIYNGWDRPNI